MKSKSKKEKILCSNCKTGEVSYALDPNSFACPYFCCRSEFECSYYVPIKVQNKERILQKFLDRIKR